MKRMYMKQLDEFHEDMPEEVLKVLYARAETQELKKILAKFKKCKAPDDYMLICTKVVEEELEKRGIQK